MTARYDPELRSGCELTSLQAIEGAIARLADLEPIESTPVPLSILRYIFQDIAYHLDRRPVTLDVWEKLRERLTPQFVNLLDASDGGDLGATVAIMNGTLKEWFALRATLPL